MTRQRNDNHSTEFGLWLRGQEKLDSKKCGYVTTNIDYLWRNYNNKKWMLIEEKRHNYKCIFPQTELFDLLDKSIKNQYYKGFFIIVFEKTNPDDGKMYLGKGSEGKQIEITKEQLFKFLKFEWPI